MHARLKLIDDDCAVAPDKMTLAYYLSDVWLPELDTLGKQKGSTRALYRTCVESYIVPIIGEVPLQKLQAADVIRLMATLKAQKRKSGHRRHGAYSLRNTFNVLRKALISARAKDLIARGPLKGVDRPKVESAGQPPKAWSETELRAFLTSVREDRLYPLWLLYATTGMRRGEALGLKCLPST